jgi:hypothetical protein
MEFSDAEIEEQARRKEEALKEFEKQVREAVLKVLEMKQDEIQRASLWKAPLVPVEEREPSPPTEPPISPNSDMSQFEQ